MSVQTVIEILAVLAIGTLTGRGAQGQTSHGETADPEAQLKPRNFNPHPFEAIVVAPEPSPHHSVTSVKDVQLIDSNSVQEDDDAPSRLFRRQSSTVFNQGPIQFPSNNNNNNEVRPSTPQQRPRFYLRPVQQRPPPPASPTQRPDIDPDNYDDDYDQTGDSSSLSKKHYAFSYVVRDHHSGDDFSHNQQQQRDGAVSGSYKVQLPDGRTQVVKYTADEEGYKADVTYIENTVADDTSPRSHVFQVAPTASRPKYYPPRPTPTQLSFERLSGGYELPNHHQPQQYDANPPQSFASTPRPFAVHPSLSAPLSAYVAHQPHHHDVHSNYVVDQQNVQIDTYNTGPTVGHVAQHRHMQPQQLQLVNPGRVVFPTSPTLYNDINVLPSPRPYSYATTAPFAGTRVSPKSTNIVSSHLHPTSGAVAAPGISHDHRYYVAAGDYNGGHHHVGYQRQPSYYVATVPQHNGIHVVRPEQALYYKQK